MVDEEIAQNPLKAYLRHMIVIQGRSPKTVEQYEQDITMFLHYLSAKDDGKNLKNTDPHAIYESSILNMNIGRIEKVTRSEVMDFLEYCMSIRGNNERARSRKLSAIRSFFRFLVIQHAIKENPAKEIDSPKLKKTLPKYLTEKEALTLLETVNGDVTSRSRTRDYAIITLFLNCGMRLNELCGISLSDVDSELRSIRVTGKGAKERIVYLNDACRSALTAYLPDRGKDTDTSGSGALFISSRHQRICDKTVQAIIYKYLKLAGLENRRFSTHKLRHTAATLMYQNGVEVRVLKDILGHENLSTTQIYTHVSDVNMEKAMASNPLSGVKAKKVKSDPESGDHE